MQVYLFNQGRSGNIGDRLISDIIQQVLEDAGSSIHLNPSFPIHKGKIQAIKAHIYSYYHDFREILHSQKVVIGGGNLIMDISGIGLRWAIHHSWLGLLCRIFHKPYIYISIGAAPLQNRTSQILYRFTLRSALHVSSRDTGSRRYLQGLTGRPDIQQIPDPALLVSSFYPRAHVYNPSNPIGICPVKLYPAINPDPQVSARYLQVQVQLISHFLSNGKKVVLFLNDEIYDQEFFHQILGQFDELPPGFSAKKSFSGVKDYLEFIQNLSLVITARLHAAIIASAYGVPSIGLGWQPKMRDFFRDQDLTGYIELLPTLENPDETETLFKEILALTSQLHGSAIEVRGSRKELENALGL